MMELLIAAVVVLIAVGILVAARGRRGRDGNGSPWWTFGLLDLTSRREEEAREERIDALFAGEADEGASASSDVPDGPPDEGRAGRGPT